MGSWGSGLYSDDFALDLRATIAAIAKLPLTAEHIVEILCEQDPVQSSDENDEDHATFWLVVADQLARRGIDSERARTMAIDIIDRGLATAMFEQLGASAADVRKRGAALAELRAKLTVPVPSGVVRKVLRKPQPLLLQTGDLVVFPTSRAHPANPYCRDRRSFDTTPWVQDGWGAALVIDCGHAFDFLAWYRPITLIGVREQKPDRESLHADHEWTIKNPGTLTLPHMKKMALEKVGEVAIDRARLAGAFPGTWLSPGIRAAVRNVSLANALDVAPFDPRLPKIPSIPGLRAILES